MKLSNITMHSEFAWEMNFVMRRGRPRQGIRGFPLAWHPLADTIRRCQMQRFPYGLVYEATEIEIIIIAVAHMHREPEYWRTRLLIP